MVLILKINQLNVNNLSENTGEKIVKSSATWITSL